MDESKVDNLPKGTWQCDVYAWRAYVASIPCETQSVTTVASFMARVTRAVVVLAVVVVDKEILSIVGVDMLVAALTDVSGDELTEVNTNILVAMVSTVKSDMRSPADKSSC